MIESMFWVRRHQFSALALSAVLAACGGGGGGDAPAPAPAPTQSTALVTSVPAATYADGSMAKASYDWLNAERSRCGFGLWAQNAQLDIAAQGMATYIKNRTEANEFDAFYATPHTQVSGKSGFTGVSPVDRAAAAGYSGSSTVSESGSFYYSFRTDSNIVRGEKLVKLMAATVYHAQLMFGSSKDAGFGVSTANDPRAPGFPLDHLTINMGTRSGVQLPSTVVTWPCQGSTASGAFTGENPNPLPAGWSLPAGAPIYVLGTRQLVITSWSITKAGSPAITDGLVLTAANDPRRYLTQSEAFIFSRTALTAGTYNVLISGTDGGVGFTRQFDFTTE